jgi:ketosteroid isomerase-like protein
MRLRVGLAVLLLVTPLAASSQNREKLDLVRSLLETERAFAFAAAAHGTRDAFLSFIADDGILFRPGPVNGKEWLLKSRPAAGVLRWEPVRAGVSAAGDLGYTTGPWDYRAKAADEPAAFGQFVTVWNKQAGGEWKFVIDHGVSHPKPERSRPTLRLSSGDSSFSGEQAQVKSALDKTESGLSWPAYPEALAEDVLFLRTKAFPVEGKAAVAAFVAANPGVLSCSPIGSAISRSGDLGYSWGSSEFRPQGGDPEAGNYLRIWRNTKSGWKLIVDVIAPVNK